MNAILTRYLGPTDHRGARIVATADTATQDGRLVLPFPYERSGIDAHRPAAEALAARLGWLRDGSRLVPGRLPDRGVAWVIVTEYD